MLKRVDVPVSKAITDFLDRQLHPGCPPRPGGDGVGYSTSGGFIDDIAPHLDEFKAQIIDGTIIVPTRPRPRPSRLLLTCAGPRLSGPGVLYWTGRDVSGTRHSSSRA